MHENKRSIIGYFSRGYTDTQKRYATSEKELLAIVMSIENFHTFLYGKKFTVWTDHQPLTFLINKKDPHKRLERWIMRLWLYDFIIKYKPGQDNVVADALSRMGEDTPKEDQNTKVGEDYFDIVVATLSISDNNHEVVQGILNDQNKDTDINIISQSTTTTDHIRCTAVIAHEPTSINDDEYDIYIQTQNSDHNIK